MYICHCQAVTDREIREAIAAGAGDVIAIARRCGAGTGCGSCLPAVRRLLAGQEAAGGSHHPQQQDRWRAAGHEPAGAVDADHARSCAAVSP